MRRLWLLSLVFLPVVCAAAEEDTTSIQCYISRNGDLGSIEKCPSDHSCTIKVDANDKHILRRNCQPNIPYPACTDKFPLSVDAATKKCQCNTDLCNSLIGEEYKCYQGGEGDCDFIESVTVKADNVGIGLDSGPTISPRQRRCISYTKDDSSLTCQKTTFTYRDKTCTIYGCEAVNTAGWTKSIADGSYYYTFEFGVDKHNATMTPVTCQGPLCHKPAGKTCGVGGLTLSLVGLMAAVMAAYST